MHARPNADAGKSRRFLAIWTLLLLAPFPAYTSAATPNSSWVRQTSGTLAWLHAIFFLDDKKGWAAGSKGTLLATNDGGQTWQARRLPTFDGVRDIFFINESEGWLVCEPNVYELQTKDAPRTYLLQTVDGGAEWQKIVVDPKDPDLRIVRAVFTSPERGWVFGEGGTVFGTRDSGVTWVRCVVPTRHLLLGGTFIDENRGWIVGAGATILQTSDGGASWQLSRLFDANGVRFSAASFVDDRLGWAVGNQGAVFRTRNGGRTWQRLNSGVTTDLYDVRFFDANEGWAVGAGGTAIYTQDGGLHWSIESTGTEHPIERLFFPDRDHGWAVGFGGTLLAYVRGSEPLLRK
jgi:photosystem II stability/assembly factor-like uncharacterized protein